MRQQIIKENGRRERDSETENERERNGAGKKEKQRQMEKKEVSLCAQRHVHAGGRSRVASLPPQHGRSTPTLGPSLGGR